MNIYIYISHKYQALVRLSYLYWFLIFFYLHSNTWEGFCCYSHFVDEIIQQIVRPSPDGAGVVVILTKAVCALITISLCLRWTVGCCPMPGLVLDRYFQVLAYYCKIFKWCPLCVCLWTLAFALWKLTLWHTWRLPLCLLNLNPWLFLISLASPFPKRAQSNLL